MKKIGVTAVKTKKTTAKTKKATTAKKAATKKKVAKKTYTITSKLPEGFKASWIKALRSGKYKQAVGHLIDDYGFCCLGVAAKVCEVGSAHLEGRGLLKRATPATTKADKAWNKVRTRIPASLRDNEELQGKLSHMNDSGNSFSTIANYIEKNH